MRRIDRRYFLKTCGLGTTGMVLSGLFARRASAAERKPNIIFILADDLGYGDLGCYGQTRIRTPNIDRMAAEGVRFTDHYAGSTVCAPSRCCLMTGLHTGHCPVRGNARWPLEPADVTVAEVLKEAGYTTGLVGKWGLGEEGSTGLPTRQGFDHFYGYLNQKHAHNYYPEFLIRNEDRVTLRNVLGESRRSSRRGGWGVAAEKLDYSHDLLAGEALRFVERNAGRPFFLYLAFTIPHANNEAGRAGMEVPPDCAGGEPYSGEDWPQPQRNHAAMITRMDRDVGRLMERLRELGLDRDTLVLFSSDNGPHREGGARPDFFDSNGPLRGIKRDLYEGGIRVPMIARWPGRIPRGSVTDHVSAFWDFLPTAAEVAGARVPAGLDGLSFMPALLGKGGREQKRHEHLYWEFTERGASQAVRMGRWKAVRLGVRKNPEGPVELYDLASDPGETKDLAPERPDIASRMAGIMRTARTRSEKFPLLGASRGKARK